MAVENRGGMRPTAPQNNPANVNALGGNGQSGNINYTGFGYGMNQAVNQQRQAAPITQPGTPSMGTMPAAPMATERPAVGITEPTAYPDEPVTTMSSNMNGSILPSILPEQGQILYDTPDKQMIRTYMPALEFWASRPGTPQETIDYVRYLRTIIP